MFGLMLACGEVADLEGSWIVTEARSRDDIECEESVTEHNFLDAEVIDPDEDDDGAFVAEWGDASYTSLVRVYRSDDGWVALWGYFPAYIQPDGDGWRMQWAGAWSQVERQNEDDWSYERRWDGTDSTSTTFEVDGDTWSGATLGGYAYTWRYEETDRWEGADYEGLIPSADYLEQGRKPIVNDASSQECESACTMTVEERCTETSRVTAVRATADALDALATP